MLLLGSSASTAKQSRLCSVYMMSTFVGALGAQGARGTQIVKELAPRAFDLDANILTFSEQSVTATAANFLHANLHKSGRLPVPVDGWGSLGSQCLFTVGGWLRVAARCYSLSLFLLNENVNYKR